MLDVISFRSSMPLCKAFSKKGFSWDDSRDDSIKKQSMVLIKQKNVGDYLDLEATKPQQPQFLPSFDLAVIPFVGY